MNYLPVLTKADGAKRYRAGEFGNKTPSWETLEEFIAYGHKEFGVGPTTGLYNLRNGKIAGGTTYYNLHWLECITKWAEMTNREDWYASEMIPEWVEKKLLIQGEVIQTPPGSGRYGLDLFYSTVSLPMRPSLQQGGQHAHGLRAKALLETNLCPNSYEWLQILLERYESHVVEFSTYRVAYGTLPGYNTVFWEVRNY